MGNGPKLFVVLGVTFILIGLLWHFGFKNFPFGKLPGDVSFKKGNFSFHFPLVTCIILSLVLSILFNIFKK
tara:strand:+ start:116 stop:328 length:213 start_codon:yes stop_codon:yes gene_type:complete